MKNIDVVGTLLTEPLLNIDDKGLYSCAFICKTDYAEICCISYNFIAELASDDMRKGFNVRLTGRYIKDGKFLVVKFSIEH